MWYQICLCFQKCLVFAFHRLPCELENARVLYEIKKKCLFSVNTKYISSRELKTYKFSLVLRTRENSDVFNSLDEINIFGIHLKKANILYNFNCYNIWVKQ